MTDKCVLADAMGVRRAPVGYFAARQLLYDECMAAPAEAHRQSERPRMGCLND